MLTWKGDRIDNIKSSSWMRNVGSYAVLLLAFSSMVFMGVCDPSGNGGMKMPSGTAAVVGDEVITAGEFKRFYASTLERFRNSQSDFDPVQFGLSRRVMEYLVSERAAYERAKSLGLAASPVEVEKLVLSEAQRFRGEDGKFSAKLFQNYLKYNGYTEASFLEEQQRALTMQKFEQSLDDATFVSTQAAEWDYRLNETKLNVEFLRFDPKEVEVSISADEVEAFVKGDGQEKIKEYYQRNNSEFNTPAEVKARHILVSYQGARNATGEGAQRSKEEALKRAQGLATKAQAEPDGFRVLAGAETDEQAGKEKGGDLGWFKAESMVKEFSDVAFALEKGKVSDAVESPFGFHIIKVEDRREAISRSQENAQDEIARKLLEQERKPEILRKRAELALVSLKEGKDSGTAKWRSTGEFKASARALPNLGSDPNLRTAALSLGPQQKLYPEVLQVGQLFYVLRLMSRSDADISKLDSEKKDRLRKDEAYMLARNMVSYERTQAKVRLEETKALWTNEEYAGWDEQRAER